MPYVTPENRRRLSEGSVEPHMPGTLNYCITVMVDRYLGPSPNYERLNAAIGVLACAQAELYRKVVSVYEDRKCAENGEVYQPR